MGFLKKMKTAFGTSKTNEEASDSSYVQHIINTIENIPFAASANSVLYGGTNDLAGYHYFQTVIVGTFKLKTHKGAKLSIVGNDFTLELKSDMLELESEISNETNTYVTKIDFEMAQEDLPKIDKSRIKSLKLSTKKEQMEFSIVHIEYDEEE